MKKYITAAALLAAGTALANAASVVLADQDELTTYSWTNAGGTGNAGNAGKSQLTLCLTAIDGLSDGDTVLLKSITLGQRTNNNGLHAETIKFGAAVSGNTVTSFIAQSSAVDTTGTIMVNATTETTALKYVFDEGVEVIVGQSYNFALIASNGNLWVNGTQNAPFAEVTTSDMVVSRGDSSYAPVYLVEAVSVPAIPEPSAFGLLAGAGALALVAARRRRRAK